MKKQEKTLGQKISRAFTYISILFLILLYTGLLERIKQMFGW